jgi:hypothetical protein
LNIVAGRASEVMRKMPTMRRPGLASLVAPLALLVAVAGAGTAAAQTATAPPPPPPPVEPLAPPPTGASPAAPLPAPTEPALVAAPPAPAQQPFYSKPWFWSLVGLVVVTGVVIALVSNSSSGVAKPDTTLGDMRAF